MIAPKDCFFGFIVFFEGFEVSGLGPSWPGPQPGPSSVAWALLKLPSTSWIFLHARTNHLLRFLIFGEETQNMTLFSFSTLQAPQRYLQQGWELYV